MISTGYPSTSLLGLLSEPISSDWDRVAGHTCCWCHIARVSNLAPVQNLVSYLKRLSRWKSLRSDIDKLLESFILERWYLGRFSIVLNNYSCIALGIRVYHGRL